jgi:hypothetical protein
MPADLFADPEPSPAARPLTVFHARLLGREQTSWEELFDGFATLKAITFSSSLAFLVRLVPRFEDAEIVFGAESILSKDIWRWPRPASSSRATASAMPWPTRRPWSTP